MCVVAMVTTSHRSDEAKAEMEQPNSKEINIGDSDEDENATIEGQHATSSPSQDFLLPVLMLPLLLLVLMLPLVLQLTITCVYPPLSLPSPTEVRLEQQTILSAVFGSIPEETQGEVLGARQRLAMKKKAQ